MMHLVCVADVRKMVRSKKKSEPRLELVAGRGRRTREDSDEVRQAGGRGRVIRMPRRKEDGTATVLSWPGA